MDNQQISHSIEGLQSGIFPNQFDNIYPDAPANGFESDWANTFNDNTSPSAGTSLYPNANAAWQSTAVSNPALVNYGQGVSKSPSFSQTVPYQNYENLRQYQRSPYDPSILQQPSTTPYGYAQPPYSQQSVQPRTIAPQALQHEPRSSATPVQQYASNNVSLALPVLLLLVIY